MIKIKLLESIMEQYAEHLEEAGANAPTLLRNILLEKLTIESQHRLYLEERLKYYEKPMKDRQNGSINTTNR